MDLDEYIAHERCTPIAAEHGGFLLCRVDAYARVYELHTLFSPEGWGREVHTAALEMFAMAFGNAADIITTFETEHAQSKPPKSFGWRPAGEPRPSAIGNVTTWFLTKAAWEQSPAWRRKCRLSPS